MSEPRFRSYFSLVLFLAVMTALGVWVSCGGNSNTSSNTGTGMVTTTINDPPTCQAPMGPYSSVYVTVTKVTANINSSAGPNDSGWQTLVDLTSGPKQIDLFSLASPACTLTTLGSTTGLAPGNYQQIRLYLLSNTATGSTITTTAPSGTNACGSSNSSGPFNCVIVNGAPSTLQLSSEAQTGIKIPPGQIAGGGINLQQGQSADISIDFNACFSIVRQGNGQYRLKPVLTAGVVSLQQNSISGKVVDSTNSNPVPGAIVLLEQPSPDNTSLDTVVASGVTGADGTFIFCPLPAGTYDVVVAATVTASGVTTTYNPTITLAVPVGTALNTSNTTITLVPEPTTVNGSTVPSTPGVISGLVTATNTASPAVGTTADVSLSAVQQANGTLWVTIPVFSGSTTSVTTDSPVPTTTPATACGSTPAGSTGCISYTLNVPGSNPQVGTFNASGTNYAAPAANPATYWVYAQATVPMDASTNPGAPDCSPATSPATFSNTNSVAVNSATTTNPPVIAFTGCQ